MEIMKAAQEFEKMLRYEYHFVLVRDRNSIPQEVTVRFDKTDFFHLCGLHKLRKGTFPQESRNKTFDRIYNGDYSQSELEKDAAYKIIENRIELISRLESFFDSDNVIFRMNSHNTKHNSKIKADYILSVRNTRSHSLFYLQAEKNTDCFHGNSCFQRDLSDENYTDGHTKLHIIKKEKTNLETAETVTLVQSFTKKTTSESTPDVVKVEFSKPKISGSSLSDAITMPTNRRMDLSDLSHYFHTIIERLKEVAANVLSRLKSAFVLPVAQNTSESPLENSSAEAAQQHTVVLPVAQSVPEYSPAPEQRYMRVSLEEAVALQANGFSFEARLSADGQDKIIEYDAAQESAIKDTLTSFHATKQRYIK